MSNLHYRRPTDMQVDSTEVVELLRAANENPRLVFSTSHFVSGQVVLDDRYYRQLSKLLGKFNSNDAILLVGICHGACLGAVNTTDAKLWSLRREFVRKLILAHARTSDNDLTTAVKELFK